MKNIPTNPGRRQRIADGVAEHLALSESELREENRSLRADVASYRDVAQTAIGQLAENNSTIARLNARITSLIVELRTSRDAERQSGAQLRALQERQAAA
jgi:hypothetical protein